VETTRGRGVIVAVSAPPQGGPRDECVKRDREGASVRITCPHCGSLAYVSGVCVENGCRDPRPVRRRQRAIRSCAHREWTRGPRRYIGGEYRRADRCKACGLRREVEDDQEDTPVAGSDRRS